MAKEYDYGAEFEELYKGIPKTMNGVKTGRKEMAYKVFLRAKLLVCPNCGTREMLCGHGGVGCTSENQNG